MKKKTDNKSENIFIKEWNGTKFNVSIPAKITNSNKPFISTGRTIVTAEKLNEQEKVGLGGG